MTIDQPELLSEPPLEVGNGLARARGEKMAIAARLGISRRTVNYWEARALELGDPVPWDRPSDLPGWYGRAHQGRTLPRKIMGALLAPGGEPNQDRAIGAADSAKKNRESAIVVGRGLSSAAADVLAPVAVEDSLVTLHRLLVAEMGHLKDGLENREDALAVRSGREDLLKLADKLRQVSKGVQADMVSAGKYVDKAAVKEQVQGMFLDFRRQVRAAFRKGRAVLLGAVGAAEWDEQVEKIAEEAERALLDSEILP